MVKFIKRVVNVKLLSTGCLKYNSTQYETQILLLHHNHPLPPPEILLPNCLPFLSTSKINLIEALPSILYPIKDYIYKDMQQKT